MPRPQTAWAKRGTLWKDAAVGNQLGRPVVSVANGREITITFGREEGPGLAGTGARALPEWRGDAITALLA